MEYKIKDNIIVYENNGFKIFNIISEKEFAVNECGKLIFENINYDDYKIKKLIEQKYENVPNDIMDIINEFKENLIEEFFEYE